MNNILDASILLLMLLGIPICGFNIQKLFSGKCKIYG